MRAVGVDTNILLRALLDDHAEQSPVAPRFLGELTVERYGYVGVPVMLELFWVLRTRYRLPRWELMQTLFDLLEVECLVFEDFEIVARCLRFHGDKALDFSDALIAERNGRGGCTKTMTFDRGAAKRVPGMTLLA